MMFLKHIYRKIRCITWSCPRCGRPFTSEIERNIHMLSCGSARILF